MTMNPQFGKFQKVSDEPPIRDNLGDNKLDLGDQKQNQGAVEMMNMNPDLESKGNDDKTDDLPSLQQYQSPAHIFEYRPEIDGIRAIAISLVVIYHAWPNAIPGGFIGVDVFFVISGYLISSIIYREIEKESFSFIKFYFRRIRRLFPALLIVLGTVLFFGMKNYTPEILGSLLKTLIASSLFGVNIYFYVTGSDYFGDGASLNPLRHFWSLGVGEQFYIFWPCVAIILIKMTVKKSTILLFLLISGSFIVSAVTTCEVSTFAFYFPLSRFWQFLIGCYLAYYNFIHSTKIKEVNITETSKTIKVFKALAFNMLSLLGLTLIISSALLIDSRSAFPGFWALMPSFGSALIIFCKDKSIFNRYVLSNRILGFIGKISYPLYLWHWPLLLFAKTVFLRFAEEWATAENMIILAVILSVATYLLVENNVRKLKGSRIVFILVSLMGLLLLVSVVALINVDRFSFLKDLQKKGFDNEGGSDQNKTKGIDNNNGTFEIQTQGFDQNVSTENQTKGFDNNNESNENQTKGLDNNNNNNGSNENQTKGSDNNNNNNNNNGSSNENQTKGSDVDNNNNGTENQTQGSDNNNGTSENQTNNNGNGTSENQTNNNGNGTSENQTNNNGSDENPPIP